MWIYVAVFFAATVIFWLGDLIKAKQRIYLDIIAILFLCLLAGFRSGKIGTDTAGYIQPMIRGAMTSSNLKDFFHYSWISGRIRTVFEYEIGYVLVVYVVSIFFKSIVVTQTVLELLIVLPIYFALRMKKDVPIWFGMLVFMLQFFNGSMNLIRQSLAMSFVFLAVTCWIQGYKKRYILYIAFAVSFHKTALIGILIMLLYEYVSKKGKINASGKTINISYSNMFIAIAAGIVSLIVIQVVVTIMKWFGLSYYTNYLGKISFMPNQIINVSIPTILLVCSFQQFRNTQKEWTFYVVMMAYTMIAGQLSSANSWAIRVRMYFLIFAIFSYPLTCKYNRNKGLSSVAMVSYLIFYWWFYYVFVGLERTVPYVMIN